ncbi:MAG: hypothetical protein IKE73_01060 [Bacilli bacterium]|nr:hypothetical protein [Bacilli bacterium]
MDNITKMIQEEELNSNRFKEISEFVNNYVNREYVNKENELLDMFNDIDYRNISREDIVEKINNYNDFFSSTKSSENENNIVLKKLSLFNSMVASQLKNLLVELDVKISSDKEQDKYNHNYNIDVELPKKYIKEVPEKIDIIKRITIDEEEKYIQVLPRKERRIYDAYNEYVEKISQLSQFILFIKVNSVTIPVNLVCNGVNLDEDKIRLDFYHDFCLKNEENDKIVREADFCFSKLLENGLTSKEERDLKYQKELSLINNNIILE